ncbi:MAG: DAK2 domain-containing protein [Oscillospiraceae bacterium]|nr:DAK2 domain-containing protein [Oscillospiraceae bacterium]
MNGKILKNAICSAAVKLEQNRKLIDELNVYPVPDGDTGTNMSMTMNSAKRELSVLPDTATISEVAEKSASAMLRGARGNSGVILSLLFRGFAKGLAGLEEAQGQEIANALEIGVQGAYKSVMQPTEGTILTVARMASQQAQLTARGNADAIAVWEEICKAGEQALEKTPEQLEILKKAGVVDAGGKGLVTIWQAMLDVFHGETPAISTEEITRKQETTAIGRVDLDEEIKFTYCTEFILEKKIKVKRIITVAGFNNIYFDDDDNLYKSFYLKDSELKNISNYCDDIVCITSLNDPYVQPQDADNFVVNCGGKKELINNGGHFNEQGGYTEFRKLLDYIK